MRSLPERSGRRSAFRVALASFILFTLPLSTVGELGDNLVKLALSDCAIPIAALCLLYYFATSRLRLPYIGLCLGHISLCVISAMFNFSATLSLGRIHCARTAEAADWVVLFLRCGEPVATDDDLAAALKAWRWGAIVCAGLGITGVVLYLASGTRTPFSEMFRAQGTLDDANLFACHLSISLLLLKLLSDVKRGARTMAAITTGILLAGILLSASRGGVLAFLCAFTVFELATETRRWRLVVGVWVVPVILLALSAAQVEDLPSFIQPAAQRLTTLTIDPRSEQGMQRSAQWEVAWEGFLSSPMIGIGRGNYKLLTSSHATYLGSYAHNTYIGAMCDLGIPGLICYLLIFFLPGFPLIRHAGRLRTMNREIRPILLAGCCLFMVVGLTINIENYRGLWVFAGIAVALPRLTSGKGRGLSAGSEMVFVIPDDAEMEAPAQGTDVQ